MVLELLGSPARPAKVPDLIARRKYAEALALLREQLERSPGDPSLRMQTAEVLVLQGKIDEATGIFESVANDFATQGFAAKAIAVLKKIQKLDPRRKDLDSRIVDLFTASAPPRARAVPAPPQPDEVAAPAVPQDAGPAFGMLLPDEGEAIDLAFDIQPAAPAEMNVDFVDIPTSAADETKRVQSPLFDDFAEEELLEVVRGLELLTFEAGDIIVTEGEKGDSLYVLTSGNAKAFVRNRDGGSTQVRQLNEGDFFGEISILTGKPRTATITAASACELLRLDRATLASITESRPRVRQVLEQFYEERVHNAAEAEIRGLDAGSSETCRQAGLARDQHGEKAPETEFVTITDEDLQDDSTEWRLLHLKKVAIEHSRAEKWVDAVQAWQQYLALRPDDVDATNVLGVLFGKLGRWKEAAQTFERLVELSSKDAVVFFNLGLSYRQLELLPQAASAYRQALVLKPDYDKAKQNLAAVVAKMTPRRQAAP